MLIIIDIASLVVCDFFCFEFNFSFQSLKNFQSVRRMNHRNAVLIAD